MITYGFVLSDFPSRCTLLPCGVENLAESRASVQGGVEDRRDWAAGIAGGDPWRAVPVSGDQVTVIFRAILHQQSCNLNRTSQSNVLFTVVHPDSALGVCITVVKGNVSVIQSPFGTSSTVAPWDRVSQPQ